MLATLALVSFWGRGALIPIWIVAALPLKLLNVTYASLLILPHHGLVGGLLGVARVPKLVI